MTESSAQYPEPARSLLHALPQTDSAFAPPLTTLGTTAARTCAHCGASTMEAICPDCGEPMARLPRQIRCRHCRCTASSELVICPGCGRELKAAPSRWVAWGGPGALVIVALLVMAPVVGAIRPEQWLRTQFSSGLSLAADFGERLEPEVVIVMTPIVESAAEAEPATAATESEPEVVALAVSEAPAVVDLPAPTLSAATPADTSVDALPVTADTQTALPTTTPTDTPVPTPTPEPAATAVPLVVASGAGVAAQVEQKPTAAASSTATWTPMPTAAGMAALLPTPTPVTGIGGAVGAIAVAAVASTETEAPTPSPTPLVHQVKPGDTLVTIAARYDVTVEAIMAANGIAPRDVYVIQPGQLLIIPKEEATPLPSATVTATATVAPVTPSPTDVGAAVRLDAPVLVSPETGTPMSCNGQTTLVWNRVQFIRDDDKYVLHLGFVSGRRDGGEELVTWVLAQPRPATQTSWDLDASLCGLASQAFGRQWRWWVEVVAEVDGATAPVSPPSPVWGFSWN